MTFPRAAAAGETSFFLHSKTAKYNGRCADYLKEKTAARKRLPLFM
jgi:hypothetical protein